MMGFVLKMMDFVLKMMNFAFKTMDSVLKTDALNASGFRRYPSEPPVLARAQQATLPCRRVGSGFD